MHNNVIRVRFAPAPTGKMHLGNIRTALMNYLFAKQKGGTFVLRIEDTDAERNFDPQAQQIQADLVWLGLLHDEGPKVHEQYGPYVQSERNHIYQTYLNQLITEKKVYRCFCTAELLEQKRLRAQALGKPPRYDKICKSLTEVQISEKLMHAVPFIWRFELNQALIIQLQDLAKGTISFELKNFSDFPLTRSDGSYTFIFANCVDDITMHISHVFRGEEHITNTACQHSLFSAFNAPIPTYWHMPLLCNHEGKKLSKRDFGFSLKDLQDEGFLPQAIVNYLAIIGGGTFTQEIFTLSELTQVISFDRMHTTGHIKYDVEKLRWINRKWIQKLSIDELFSLVEPLMKKAFDSSWSAASLAQKKASVLLAQTEVTTLTEIPNELNFVFGYETVTPVIKRENIVYQEHIALLEQLIKSTTKELFLETIKSYASTNGLHPKEMYKIVRFCTTGNLEGPSIGDLINLIGIESVKQRIKNCINH